MIETQIVGSSKNRVGHNGEIEIRVHVFDTDGAVLLAETRGSIITLHLQRDDLARIAAVLLAADSQANDSTRMRPLNTAAS